MSATVATSKRAKPVLKAKVKEGVMPSTAVVEDVKDDHAATETMAEASTTTEIASAITDKTVEQSTEEMSKATESSAATLRNVEQIHEECLAQLKTAVDSVRMAIKLVREAGKTHARTLRTAQAGKRKAAGIAESGSEGAEGSAEQPKKRDPAGFTKARKISDQMADFLSGTVAKQCPPPTLVPGVRMEKILHCLAACKGVTRDMEMTSQRVTQLLYTYFECRNLHNPQNHRHIMYETDPQLVNLIRLEGEHAGGQLTYFNLQSAIKHHFTSPPKAEEAAL